MLLDALLMDDVKLLPEVAADAMHLPEAAVDVMRSPEVAVDAVNELTADSAGEEVLGLATGHSEGSHSGST